MNALIKGTFDACPISFIAFILAAVTGVTHSIWIVISQPGANFNEIIGVSTVWFGPWLVMAVCFILMWANSIALLKSIQRAGVRDSYDS